MNSLREIIESSPSVRHLAFANKPESDEPQALAPARWDWREVRRVLVPGSPVVCSEVLNATFFIDPYSPDTLRYWMAFNDHQLSLGGDPFVGAKLGNLLQSVGYRDVSTEVKTFHLDNRAPGERAEFLAYWTELLLSGAPALLAAGKTSQEIVDGMTRELDVVARDPNSVFFYSFIQARARAW